MAKSAQIGLAISLLLTTLLLSSSANAHSRSCYHSQPHYVVCYQCYRTKWSTRLLRWYRVDYRTICRHTTRPWRDGYIGPYNCSMLKPIRRCHR